ncbi:hypothetical protein H7J93_07340 [Mycobacterium barrassiae]|uniref:hypothetical protein n=1 Tax=Mycobacterium barrassiae TaxID=319709 RepID=UPI00226598D5|nr:hypothetical protein [Mycobacterium barrassiae]MCV7299447.1 hypothetical protein [Mycobacterium barrassiae]
MVEPSIGAAKAIESVGKGVSEATGNVLTRMFGPAGDEIGEYLRRNLHYRLNNAEKIAEKAERKLEKQARKNGTVAPRLAWTLLEEGTYSDDELMTDYLGGVLAAGITPSGRDDRGVSWSKMITSMSALQLRAHFIFYREWALALHGKTDIDLRTDDGITKAVMYVNDEELTPILAEVVPDLSQDAVVTDVLTGLLRFDLIGDGYLIGNPKEMDRPFPEGLPFPEVFRVHPTITGLTLFGWGCGLADIHPLEFTRTTEFLDVDVPIARPSVFLPDAGTD